ncbi:phage Gp37/Gp68 family protein [Actinomadura yumaensis]
MADHTPIEWTDATWNIVTGCSLVSPGCTNCYAMKLAGTRLRDHPSRQGLTADSKAGPVWNGQVRFNGQWLDQPLRWTKPRKIFVCAHGDLFHDGVSDDWLDQIFAVMALCPQHVFQGLTKRPERMRDYLTQACGRIADRIIAMRRARGDRDMVLVPLAHVPPGSPWWPLPNVWLGVSVEHQARADERIPVLLDTPAAVRWISAEPLLGPVDLQHIKVEAPGRTFRNALTGAGLGRTDGPFVPLADLESRLDWVVVGGESGPGARPMHPDWARSLRDQCAAAGTPFLFKQWGDYLPQDQTDASGLEWAVGHSDPRNHDWEPQGFASIRIGKKAAGRLLDGVQHDGYPEVQS